MGGSEHPESSAFQDSQILHAASPSQPQGQRLIVTMPQSTMMTLTFASTTFHIQHLP